MVDTLTATLFANPAAFGAGQLNLTLHQNTSFVGVATFGVPRITQALDVTAILANVATFGAPQVAASTGALLLPTLFENQTTFGAATITGGMTAEGLEQRFYGKDLEQRRVWSVGRTLPLDVTEGAMMVFANGAWRVMAADGPAGAVLTNVGGLPQFVPSWSGGTTRTVTAVNVNTTLDSTYDIVLVTANTDSPTVITLPSAASAILRAYTVKKVAGTFEIAVTPQVGEGIDSAANAILSITNDAIEFISDGSAWWII